MEKKKIYDKIPERIDDINKLLKNKTIESIIDFQSTSPDSSVDLTKSEDIRDLMPKKYIDFSKAITELGG